MTPEAKLAFGRRLQQLLDQKGWNCSDLARKIWGTITTKAGYVVARNRDRVSVYVRGKAFPSPQILQKIATVLGVTVAELAPEFGANDPPEWSFTKIRGQNMVLVQINQRMDERLAAQIRALVLGTPR